MHKLWKLLNESKKLKRVDLSHMMDNTSPYWSGIPEGSVELGSVVFDWGNPMLECQIQTFKFPGQFGTHIDFPHHFSKNGLDSEAFDAHQFVFPLCVIDISEKVKKDPNYALTVEDIHEYETKYGKIPEDAFVALRSDWSKNWPDGEKMSGIDSNGNENFPGWSLEALKFLYEKRKIAGNGHETLDTDSAKGAAACGDLECERYVLDNGHFQVELLNNLDQLPPAGSVIFISWPHFKGACGLPARVWAVSE